MMDNEKTLIDNMRALILKMGHVIRQLDEDCEHIEYWTNDGTDQGGEYVPALEEIEE